jgi:signal transduction histidine kinase
MIEAYRDVTVERRLEERLAGVHVLGRELVLSRDERQIAQVAVDAAMLLSRSPVCALWLVDEEGVLTRWAHTHGAHVVELDTLPLDDAEGIVPAAARSGEPIYVPDVQEDSRYRAVDKGSEIRSVLCVPLKVKDRVLGVMNAESDHLDAFDEVDQRLFATLVDYTALALENARLYQEITRRLTETHTLQEVTRASASTLDFDEVLSRALQTIHRMLDIDALAFVLPDESRERLVVHPSFIVHEQPLLDEDPTIPLEGSVTGFVYTTGEPVLIPDISKDARYFECLPGVHSEMAVPVKVDGDVVAVLNAEDSRPAAFDEDDLHLFEAIAAQLGIVMENAHLYEAEREQRRLLEQSQAQLVQSEKLAATGRLTASLAHEINNPLQAIHNSLQIMISFPLEPEEQQEYLHMAGEDVERLIDMVGRMLDFARKPKREKKPTDVNAIVEKTLKLSNKYLQHSNVVLKKALSPDLPVALATPGELQQVFLNLVLNAVDAMPEGGTLCVSSSLSDEGRLAVAFSDTGQGVPVEHRDRIFEPFFSTKEEGTGLGLSVSYNVVKRHGGKITVQSELGEGATFTVRLPAIGAGDESKSPL